MMMVVSHIAYFSVVILLALSVQDNFLEEAKAATNTIFILGFLGTWRYSWAAINFTRAIYFRRVSYPVRRARARRRYKERGYDSHCYVLATTYGMPAEATLKCYRGLFKAAARGRGGATIVSSVVDGADERLVQSIYDSMPMDMSNVRLIIDRIKSNGKRDAMAQTLRIIRSFNPTERDILIFLDGDTIPPEDIIEQSAPWFTQPEVGALTTDEGVLISKDNLYKDWFIMRFNQRQVMMCSMGQSKHVLTLTGRMSVFRADLATNPEFIEGVDADYLDHWRLGRVNFLTGDDKSTWFWLLKNGYQMLYLPDVQSLSMEEQPRDTFFDSAQTLMVRWFGNMARTNGRAIKLGPKPMKSFFTWWSILDQRVSMWTTLVGPMSVLMAAILYTPSVIPVYIAWVMVTRYIFCVIMSLFRGTWFPVTHPLLLYFSQVFGAAVKTFVLHRLDKQKWTRQGAGVKVVVPLDQRLKAYESTLHHTLSILWLTLAVFFLSMV